MRNEHQIALPTDQDRLDEAFGRIETHLNAIDEILEEVKTLISPDESRVRLQMLGGWLAATGEEIDQFLGIERFAAHPEPGPHPPVDVIESQVRLAEQSREESLFPDNTYEEGVIAMGQMVLGVTTVLPMDEVDEF